MNSFGKIKRKSQISNREAVYFLSEKLFQTQKLRKYFNLHDIWLEILWQAQYIVYFPVDKRIQTRLYCSSPENKQPKITFRRNYKLVFQTRIRLMQKANEKLKI